MFFGDYYPRLDEKGRLALPARFRDRLGEGMVITKGQDRCLFVYPRSEFDAYAARLRTASTTDRKVRDYERMVFSGADDPTPDKQGRILLKPDLRRYAALDRDVAVIGANSRVEIWSADTWRRFADEHEQQFVDFSDEVLPLATPSHGPP